METKNNALILVLVVLTFSAIVFKSRASDGVLVGHGDHFEMTCRDDGLVDFCHIILVTANITKNVTCEATYSFDGSLEGDVSYVVNEEIYKHEILYRPQDGTSMIFANFSATLKPLEITKLTLKYTVEGLLNYRNGTWRFKQTINTDSTSPPEVLLKIPKPSTQFHKLVIENIVPAPHVFVEESHYYVLVWKSSLFTFGSTSSTYVDVIYKTVWNPESFNLWLILQVAVFFIGVVLGFFVDVVKRLVVKPKVSNDSSGDTEHDVESSKITFMSIMKMTDLDKKVRDIIAERNLTLAGFTLTALAFIVGFYKEDFASASTLISWILLAMFMFFLGSQLAHEAESFWQVFSADISQYAGIIVLMTSFYYFISKNLQDSIVMYFPMVLIAILVVYLARGAWRIYKFYKGYKKKKEKKEV